MPHEDFSRQPKRPRHFPWLAKTPIAHRGLWNSPYIAGPYVENSLPAFKAAIAKDLAIELDVRLTADGGVAVFHDETLRRLTNQTERLDSLTLTQLKKTPYRGAANNQRLSPSAEHCIPSLNDILELVAGQVPLYIEIKTEKNTNTDLLASSVRRALEGYLFPVAVMSFDPRIVAWFARSAPAIARGMIVDEAAISPFYRRFAHRVLRARLQPDFLSVDVELLADPLFTDWRQQGGLIITWTVKDRQDQQRAAQLADAPTFEGELPLLPDRDTQTADKSPLNLPHKAFPK